MLLASAARSRATARVFRVLRSSHALVARAAVTIAGGGRGGGGGGGSGGGGGGVSGRW